jgi:hypothetical protein
LNKEGLISSVVLLHNLREDLKPSLIKTPMKVLQALYDKGFENAKEHNNIRARLSKYETVD